MATRMRKLVPLVMGLVAGALALPSFALAAAPAEGKAPVRVGLGQDNAKEPPMLRNLGLDNPVVAQKYTQDADLLRFLRATYSEACTRGMLAKVLGELRLDPQHRNKPEVQDITARLLDGRRIWKMSSFELETAFGRDYLHIANYCDCMLLELADKELTNPRRGLEVLEKLPQRVRTGCEKIASEQTQQQLNKYKSK